MKTNKTKRSGRLFVNAMAPGFTLVELLIAMVVGIISMGAIFATYVNVSESFAVQRDLADIQQNLRASMFLIKNDLRNSGRNGLMDGTVGIVNIDKVNGDADDATGYPRIRMTSLVDVDGDGQAEPGAMQIVEYRVTDAENDGRRELRRQFTAANGAVTGWELVMDGIEDIGFAYAYDNDNNLDLDRVPGAVGNAVIWGIDTNNDNALDTNLDNNADGDIDDGDDTNGDGVINNTDNVLGTPVPLTRIRAVRIWLLGRAVDADPDYLDNHVYVVGHKVIDMVNDPAYANRRNFRHYLLSSAIALPNHQWLP